MLVPPAGVAVRRMEEEVVEVSTEDCCTPADDEDEIRPCDRVGARRFRSLEEEEEVASEAFFDPRAAEAVEVCTRGEAMEDVTTYMNRLVLVFFLPPPNAAAVAFDDVEVVVVDGTTLAARGEIFVALPSMLLTRVMCNSELPYLGNRIGALVSNRSRSYWYVTFITGGKI